MFRITVMCLLICISLIYACMYVYTIFKSFIKILILKVMHTKSDNDIYNVTKDFK